MAYKFQRGAAILSGSIKAEDGLVETDVDDLTAANIVAEIDAGEIPIAKLAENQISGKALGTNLDALSVDDSSIEFSAGSNFNGSAASSIRVKALGITNAMLAGSIASSKVAELSAFDTDDLAEGSSNLYYTDARARASVSADITGNGGRGSLSYDNSTGVFSYEGVTQAEIRGDISVADAGGDGSLSYNSSTGVITYTGPSQSEVLDHLDAGTTNSIEMALNNLGMFTADLIVKESEFEITGDDGLTLKAQGIANSKLLNSSLSVVAGLGLSGGGPVDLGQSVSLAVEVSGAVKIANDKVGLSGSIAGDCMSALGGVDSISSLHVVADESSIESVGLGALRVKAGGITNAMLAGEIASSNIDELNKFDTDDLAEGSNLYYTDARARASVSVTDAGGDGSLSYNSGTGVITYTGPSAGEVQAHLSAGDGLDYSGGIFSVDLKSAGGLQIVGEELAVKMSDFTTDDLAEGSNLYYTDARWDSKMAAADTGDLAEGSNLYYTDARARASVSVSDAGGDGSLSYNNSTGVITYTGPSASEVRAHLSVSDSDSVDLGYAAGQISADVKLASSSALEIIADAVGDPGGIDLKSTIAGDRTFSGNLIVSGDLTVNGTNTILNTTSLEVEDINIMIAKGAADSQAANGAGLTIDMGSDDDLTFNWHDGDQVMQLKKGSSYADLEANMFIGSFVGNVAQDVDHIGDADGTLIVGFNYGSADTTALRTWTLPASPSKGQVVHVKAPSAVHADGIKIQKAGSQSIDGEDFILLESPFAAVNLMYVASNTWRIY